MLIPCVVCDGKNSEGCAACGGSGHHELATCPKKFITADVVHMVQLSEHATHGIPPVAGGMLNQTASFCAFLQAFRDDEAMWEADKLDRLKQKPPTEQ